MHKPSSYIGEEHQFSFGIIGRPGDDFYEEEKALTPQ
jgi:hypothetical protein